MKRPKRLEDSYCNLLSLKPKPIHIDHAGKKKPHKKETGSKEPTT